MAPATIAMAMELGLRFMVRCVHRIFQLKQRWKGLEPLIATADDADGRLSGDERLWLGQEQSAP